VVVKNGPADGLKLNSVGIWFQRVFVFEEFVPIIIVPQLTLMGGFD